jgi:lipoate-protein ligase A
MTERRGGGGSDAQDEWRVLPLEANDAVTNMAIDEAISEAVASGDAPPTIRFYRWQPSAVSIGYFQSLTDEVDLEACQNVGVDYVRRRTGGGAVYHDYDGEVTYSVVAPESYFSRDVEESYEEICDRIVAAMDRLGIDAQFSPINDVVADGRKISGNAQTRRKDVLLQHGTVLHAVDAERMFTYLRPDVEKVSDKLVQSVRQRVTSVEDLRGEESTVEETYDALRGAFTEGRGVEETALSATERERAEELTERYESEDWNHQR